MEESSKFTRIENIELPQNLKLPPLSMSAIEQMDDTRCLEELMKCTGLPETHLFKINQSEQIWTKAELARLALFYLEGSSMRHIFDFYNRELSLLMRKDPYISSELPIYMTISRHFSNEIRQIIKKKRRFLLSPEGVMLDPEAKKIISEIEQITSLPRERLFSGKRFPGDKPARSQIRPVDILLAFKLRIQGVKYPDIVRRLNLQTDTKTPYANFPSQIYWVFSDEARNFLPRKRKSNI